MRWPWRGASPKHRLVVAWSDDAFTFVQTDDPAAGQPATVQRCGQLQREGEAPAEFARRIRALGLPGKQALAVLPLAQCQLLQIEAPAVPADEFKAAARWRIKDMVDAHLDDLTLDVMHVGDGRPRPQKQLFVAAAANAAIEAIGTQMAQAGLGLAVIDIRETSQRNLQTAAAEALGLHERATAALMLHEGACLLTISANDELFYTRRLDWDEASVAHALAPIEEHTEAFDAYAQPLHTIDGSEMPHIVDYGAAPDPAAQRSADMPRLVIELQRSVDVWERSWPELPLATLLIEAGSHTAALVSLLEQALGLKVQPLATEPTARGFAAACDGNAALQAACLPLLGALRRTETRKP